MRRVLLNWFRRRRRPLIFSVVFISIYELWKMDKVDDEPQPQLERALEHRLGTLPHRFRDVPLSDVEDDLQLDTDLEAHHPGHRARDPSTARKRQSATAAVQHQLTDIEVDTSGPVVNPHLFIYIINCADLCRGVDVFLVNYVHTAVEHFTRRARIRKTWALQSHYRNFSIRTVFFVGLSNKADWLQDALQYEANLYNDIVQENFLDTYR